MPQLTPAQQFADRLAQERRERAARERRDIEKQEIAEAIGISKSTYGRYEAGLSMPDDTTMIRLAAYLGVTPAWLRYGQEPRNASAVDASRSGAEPYFGEPVTRAPVAAKKAANDKKRR